MNLLFSALKAGVIVVITLLMSQITLKGKRICDHVGALTGSATVQKPIHLISSNFDFTDGKTQRSLKAGAASGVKKTQSTDETPQ